MLLYKSGYLVGVAATCSNTQTTPGATWGRLEKRRQLHVSNNPGEARQNKLGKQKWGTQKIIICLGLLYIYSTPPPQKKKTEETHPNDAQTNPGVLKLSIKLPIPFWHPFGSITSSGLFGTHKQAKQANDLRKQKFAQPPLNP